MAQKVCSLYMADGRWHSGFENADNDIIGSKEVYQCAEEYVVRGFIRFMHFSREKKVKF